MTATATGMALAILIITMALTPTSRSRVLSATSTITTTAATAIRHGLVDESIKRSREGLRAVGLSLAILALAAGAQLAIFIASGSVALLADLIHNVGDAGTAIPLGAAFLLRSARAERWAGLFVVATIFVSACVAGVEAISRLIHPRDPDPPCSLWRPLASSASAGTGSLLRSEPARDNRLDSPALIADGNHARADSYVSLAVVATAAVVAVGLPIADPLIGLAITAVILKITWDSWRTALRHPHSHSH